MNLFWKVCTTIFIIWYKGCIVLSRFLLKVCKNEGVILRCVTSSYRFVFWMEGVVGK